MSNVRVIFAGEGAVGDGGPFREFLRLSMQNLPKLSRMVFGEENQLFFTASLVDVSDKCYYKSGQLSALSILNLAHIVFMINWLMQFFLKMWRESKSMMLRF